MIRDNSAFLKKALRACRVVFVVWYISGGFVGAQTVQLFQGIGNTLVTPGDTIRIVIKNNGTETTQFYPLTVFDHPEHLLFLNNQSFTDHLLAQGDAISAIRELARIYKSPYFVNSSLEYEYTYDPATLPRQFAIVPSVLSVCYRQCGQFWRQASTELSEAGIVSLDSMRDVTCQGHSLGEAILNGDTVLLDFDSAEPRFLDTLTDGSWVSAADIQASSNVLYTQRAYCYNTSQGCTSLISENEQAANDSYAHFFQDASISYSPAVSVKPINIEGAWTLCAGCSFEVEFSIPKYFLNIADSAIQESLTHFNLLLNAEEIDSGTQLLRQLLNSPSDAETQRAFIENDILFYNDQPTFSQYFDRYASNIRVSPIAKLMLPTKSGGYVLGTDVALPFLIHDVNASAQVTLGDTSLPTGQATFNLWRLLKSKEEDSTTVVAPRVSASQVQYLQSGYIPSASDASAKLYYNPIVYRIPMGIQAQMLNGSADSLSVSVMHSLEAPTAIVEPIKGNWQCKSGGTYYTLQMQVVNPPLLPGIYLEQCNSIYRKIIVR